LDELIYLNFKKKEGFWFLPFFVIKISFGGAYIFMYIIITSKLLTYIMTFSKHLNHQIVQEELKIKCYHLRLIFEEEILILLGYCKDNKIFRTRVSIR